MLVYVDEVSVDGVPVEDEDGEKGIVLEVNEVDEPVVLPDEVMGVLVVNEE